MHVVILGCGRSGSTLALTMSSRGHKVTVVDRNPETLRRRLSIAPAITQVVGNGLDADVLEKAGVQTCDAFFALTRGDNTNLMAAQIVQRRYNVSKVAVKVADPLRADAYRALGLFCINASAILAGMCQDWLLDEAFKPAPDYNVLVEELKV